MNITEKTVEGRRRVRSDYEGSVLTEEECNTLLIKFFQEINFSSTHPTETGCFNFADAEGDLTARFEVGSADPKRDFKSVAIKVEAGSAVEEYEFDLPWDVESSIFSDKAKAILLKELSHILKEIRMLYQELGYS